MSTIGHWFFERGDGASPEVFTRVCEVTDIPEFGEEAELVEDTTFCSAAESGSKSYNAGLAEGSELTITCNRDPESTVQAQLIQDAKDRHIGNYRYVEELDGSPANAFEFSAVAKSWKIQPQLNSPNKFVFGCKVRGEIVQEAI